MRNLTRFITIGISVGLLSLFQGCATLDQTECQTANWEIIGLEDGSAGRAISYLGEHRSACADYGISPDLEAYRKGHANGVAQYCTYDRGYNLAARGSHVNSVCERNRYPGFYAGFSRGQEAYEFERQITGVVNQIQGLEDRLSEIDRQVIKKEALIVADETIPRERRLLLREIKDLGYEKIEIIDQLPDLESELSFIEQQYEQFKRQK